MALVKWHPLSRLSVFDNLFRANFDDFFGFRLPSVSRDSFSGSSEPRVDIKETNDEITISAELPGIDRKDIKVEVKDNVLSISGEKKAESEDEGEGYYRRESNYGKFYRAFRIPEGIDVEKSQSKFKDGVLIISLTKPEEVKPKAIEIKVE